MSEIALEVRDARFRWAKRSEDQFHHVNLSLRRGEVCAVLGPNGAGKTTFLRCLMGLLPWSEGETLLFGEPMRRKSEREIWRLMAYVPQARSQQVAYTVEQMVLLGRAPRLGVFAKPGERDVRLARETMETLEIGHLRDRLCTRISGGELQMVLIARALCAEPSIMILDEPESNLDYKNQQNILRILKRLASESSISILFNTHYPEHALRLADQTLLIHRGQTTVGRSDALLNDENLSRLFSIPIAVREIALNERTYAVVVPLSDEKEAGLKAERG